MINQRPSDYFEGVMQIRDGNKELMDWIHDRVRKDKKAKIAKEKKVRGGVDLYMSDQHYMQSLGKKMKTRFSGILKVTRRLHTQDRMTSKQVYRVTVFFKPLAIKRGEVVTFQGEKVEILRIFSKRAQIKNVKTGEKREVDLERLLRSMR